MENHGLGTHNDERWAESSTGNTPQFIRPICPNQPIIWDIFEKSPHHMSIVHIRQHQTHILSNMLNRRSLGEQG